MRYNENMQLISQTISVRELERLASKMFGSLVKAVVDVEKEIVVVDAELHADEEQFLLERGSEQKNLWGINLHPDHFGTDKFIEFDSMINLRPHANNYSRGIEDKAIRDLIIAIVKKKVTT